MGIDMLGWTLLKFGFKGTRELKIDTNVVTSPSTTEATTSEATTSMAIASVATTLPYKASLSSPQVRERLRKITSEENFVKFQVPWIL
jgi:hypothetical protein